MRDSLSESKAFAGIYVWGCYSTGRCCEEIYEKNKIGASNILLVIGVDAVVVVLLITLLLVVVLEEVVELVVLEEVVELVVTPVVVSLQAVHVSGSPGWH